MYAKHSSLNKMITSLASGSIPKAKATSKPKKEKHREPVTHHSTAEMLESFNDNLHIAYQTIEFYAAFASSFLGRSKRNPIKTKVEPLKKSTAELTPILGDFTRKLISENIVKVDWYAAHRPKAIQEEHRHRLMSRSVLHSQKLTDIIHSKPTNSKTLHIPKNQSSLHGFVKALKTLVGKGIGRGH